MGMGIVIPSLVIVSISIMLVVSILPVYAHIPGTPEGTCPNGWEIVHLDGLDPENKPFDKKGNPVDANGNDHICEKDTGKKIMLKDDHILGKNKV